MNKKPVTVPGPYTTKSSELCLLGIKGHVTKYIGTRPRQIVIKKREEHSKKPDVVRDRISKMFPNCNKLEMFARSYNDEWDVFGNEVESDVELNG